MEADLKLLVSTQSLPALDGNPSKTYKPGPALAQCQRCKKVFRARAYRRLKVRFCSRECRKDRVSITCHCGKVFEVVKARQHNAKYCSYGCRDEWQRTHINQKWLRAGQRAMRAKWRNMSPAERLEQSNIKLLLASAKTKRVRKIFSITKKGNLNPMKRPEVARKVSATIRKKHLKFFSEKMRNTWRQGKLKHVWERGATVVSPNKSEAMLFVLLQKELPAFRFVGNGAFWIGPCKSGKRRNPDFIDGATRKVILLNGEYWHSKRGAVVERKDYEGKGWKVLQIWCMELRVKQRDCLLRKLRRFGRV